MRLDTVHVVLLAEGNLVRLVENYGEATPAVVAAVQKLNMPTTHLLERPMLIIAQGTALAVSCRQHITVGEVRKSDVIVQSIRTMRHTSLCGVKNGMTFQSFSKIWESDLMVWNLTGSMELNLMERTTVVGHPIESNSITERARDASCTKENNAQRWRLSNVQACLVK
jgi:hypothetical protein